MTQITFISFSGVFDLLHDLVNDSQDVLNSNTTYTMPTLSTTIQEKTTAAPPAPIPTLSPPPNQTSTPSPSAPTSFTTLTPAPSLTLTSAPE